MAWSHQCRPLAARLCPSDGLEIKDYPVRTAAVTSSTGLASLISELDVLLVQGHELGVFVRGEADIPLIIQDRKFTEAGDLDEDLGGVYGALGDRVLINGTDAPFFQVATTRVRLRVLTPPTGASTTQGSPTIVLPCRCG
ncbi:hypothetical protein [Streptomyces sp. NPDC102264]|uniref:hypothetical protein n=1 Tax=Streptomyces sp. NPDC102264 TaxID=3366149 RepID=UPI003815EE61